MFECRDGRRNDHGQHGERHQEIAELQVVPREVGLEHDEIETQQHIQRHLGRAGSEEYRDGVGRVRVRIGQPGVQREDGGFQGKAHGDEAGGD